MYNFNDFLLEKELADANFQLFKQVALTLDESELLEWIDVNDFSMLNEESIIDKLKTKLEAAKTTLKERGKSALTDIQQKIISIGGSIKNIVSEIAQKAKVWVTEFVKHQFSVAKQFVAKHKTELNERVKKIQDKKKLILETTHIEKMGKIFISWISSGFFKQFELAGIRAAGENVSEAIEIFESNKTVIPYSHKIVSLIHNFPPFDMLHGIEHAAGKFSSFALSRTSYKISKLTKAIEPIKFEVIPALIGIVVGYKIEHMAKDAIIEMIPGIGTIVSIISSVALAIAIIEVIEIINDEYDNE